MVNTLEEYLKVYPSFMLGKLTTESFHPLTRQLSTLANDEIDVAFNVLKQVDMLALNVVKDQFELILKLKLLIKQTIDEGNIIFLCGCGATGRLSIVLESLFRQVYSDRDFSNHIVSFMAGGDVALIKSIESFEDETQFGSRQLDELGFKEGDLLIASTEGGETSFVIGAAQKASLISPDRSVFVYCNSDYELNSIDRSRGVIENPGVFKFPLACGPMALSGSTRMQATSVMMLAVGLALLNIDDSDGVVLKKLEKVLKLIDQLDYSLFSPLTLKESELYQKDQYLIYQTDSNLGLSVLTDTTERSPTFGLDPFENFKLDNHMSLCYLSLQGIYSADDAWRMLLKRAPRCLEWPTINGIASIDRLMGFDISENSLKKREKLKHQHVFNIAHNGDELFFDLEGTTTVVDVNGFNQLEVHLILKLLLNAHSTLVMGRMNRYMDNMMTWVKASNLKLIDRSIRYVQQLLKNRSIHADYETVALKLFQKLPHVTSDRPIVQLTLECFLD